MSEEKKHWYCFSYIGNSRGGKLNETVSCSTYTGYKTKAVTMSRIQENKVNANMSDSSVLVACSYLGEMTKEEFTS